MDIQPQGRTLVAAVQLTSTADKEANFVNARSKIEQAAARGAKLICLPECFMFIGSSAQESLQAAEPIDGGRVCV